MARRVPRGKRSSQIFDSDARSGFRAVYGCVMRHTADSRAKRHLYIGAVDEDRQWANQQGIEVSKRGRINTDVIQAFKTAHNTKTD